GVAVRLTVTRFTCPAIHEELRHLLQRPLPPLGDLDRMHLELRSQLAQRLLAADRLDYNPCFELRTVLFSRRRHRPLLVNNSAENISLLPGLKSWDHYSCHQALAALLHASLFPAQFLFSLAQRVRILCGLATAIDFGLD